MCQYKDKCFPILCDINSQCSGIFHFACYDWNNGEFYYLGLLVSLVTLRQSYFCCFHPQNAIWGIPGELRSLALVMCWPHLFIVKQEGPISSMCFPHETKAVTIFSSLGLLFSCFLLYRENSYSTFLGNSLAFKSLSTITVILSLLYFSLLCIHKLPHFCVMPIQGTIIQVCLWFCPWYFDIIIVLFIWHIAIPSQF